MPRLDLISNTLQYFHSSAFNKSRINMVAYIHKCILNRDIYGVYLLYRVTAAYSIYMHFNFTINSLAEA